MAFRNRLAKSPNYVRRFGLVSGLRLLWRVERDLPKKSEVVQRYDIKGYPPIYLRDTASDHAIFWQCLVQCHYDFFGFPQSRRLISAYEQAASQSVPPLIIDCGANIGLAAVWFAGRFPKAQIYAIEPDADNFRMLQMNTAAFGDRVKAVQGGIWPERGHLKIVNPESGAAAFRVASTTASQTGQITAYTIDDVCFMAGVKAPFIVKLDIEGGQSKLFSANTGWVAQTQLISLELDDWLMPWQGTSRSFFSCVSHYPFDYLIHGESIFCFRDFAHDGSANGYMSRSEQGAYTGER